MWLRRLLVAAYGLEERSAHTPDELDWETLPERYALQLHWHRTPEFRKTLRQYGFSVAVLARHPLDVLVSILHFAPYEPQTARWLDGEGGSEESLPGANPTSSAFLAYAIGQRAKALLSVTPEWWDYADARTRYEDLVADPPGELGRMVEALGGEPAVQPAMAVEAASFGRLRDEATNMHFWQGRPGLWNELVPTRYALAIASRSRRCSRSATASASTLRWRAPAGARSPKLPSRRPRARPPRAPR
jgi:hypothetical protein